MDKIADAIQSIGQQYIYYKYFDDLVAVFVFGFLFYGMYRLAKKAMED
jgi:hypothetical protein